MINIFLIIIGKIISSISRLLNLGHGSTWPGEIVLSLNKNFIRDIFQSANTKVVLIAGTNGKTTTGKLIQTILENDGRKTFQNESGANLLNGIASSIILHTDIFGKLTNDYAIFETDEGALPLVLQKITPDYLILLNLFRDQLDRYGEVNTIAKKWQKALAKLPKKTTVILNGDDPQIAYLEKAVKGKVFHFGLSDKTLHQKNYQHATDSLYCPACGTKLIFDTVYFSHLGIWHCPMCQLKRPSPYLSEVTTYPLVGVYNRYNTHAAILFARLNNISSQTIKQSLKVFSPAFGRQEVLEINNKRVQIFLSKNPTGFNQTLQTVKSLGAKTILLALNDRIPDGRDVSWIWDVDFEDLKHVKNIIVSGERAYDMGLRMKYAECKFELEENLKKAITMALEQTSQSETLYILPTYSAMLEVRKILTGRKIL